MGPKHEARGVRWCPVVPPEQVATGAEASPREPGGICLDPGRTCPCEGSSTWPGPLAASASVERTNSTYTVPPKKPLYCMRYCFKPFQTHTSHIIPSATLQGLCQQLKPNCFLSLNLHVTKGRDDIPHFNLSHPVHSRDVSAKVSWRI